jgi:SAM-dependent methyltransferase
MVLSMKVHMVLMDDSLKKNSSVREQGKMIAVKIAQAFKTGRWLRGYIQGKLLADPIFDRTCEVIPKQGASVTDLGCGLGLLGLWLQAHGHRVLYSGCDLGGWKIQEGRLAALRLGYEGITLHECDMMQFPLGNADVVCAFDVLHYLPNELQEQLVCRLAEAARGGSLVLVRNGMRGCGWRSLVTLLEEWWTRCSGWIGGGEINFPERTSLVAAFERAGCSVKAQPLWGRTPFSSYLLQVVSRSDTQAQP